MLLLGNTTALEYLFANYYGSKKYPALIYHLALIAPSIE
jgi:hypothetical protein